MATWTPGQPWPGAIGGASSPHWSPYVRLWVLAAIGSGNTFHMGAHTYDRLDAGNVLGGGSVTPNPPGKLWVDMSCDVVDLTIAGGASSAQGIFSKPDASTLTVTIADPKAIYDPLNPDSPFSYGGVTRLTPGAPVQVFAEVVDPATAAITRWILFTGTADSWGEDWTPKPSNRTAELIATDATKLFARMDRPEQPAVGAGDTVAQRIQRIVTYFGWAGTIVPDPAGGTVTLQATTLAQSAWEMFNRTLDDELGWIHVTADGKLRWLGRHTWFDKPAPVIELGCGTGKHDILVDANPSAIDRQMRNAVYAARTGGTTQVASSSSSIAKYDRYEYSRTDLGLNDDTQTAQWATVVVQLYAYPQVQLAGVDMVPAIATQPWKAWADVFGVDLVSEIVHIVWTPPDLDDSFTVDARSRVVGYQHRITRAQWEVTWQLVAANVLAAAGNTFHMGPDSNDRLSAGFVMAA